MKARSTLVRLEALEGQVRARVTAVESVKEDQGEQAVHLLTPADREAVFEMLEAGDVGSSWWAEVLAAGDAVTGEPLPGGEAARAWWEVLEATPEGLPYTVAVSGTAAYFEAEAGRCDAVKEETARTSAEAPEGVTVHALATSARWSAGWWRYMAALARVIGEVDQPCVELVVKSGGRKAES